MALPTGNVLGYGSASSIAPNLIQNAGQSIVQSLRATGQSIAENVAKIQTTKQLKAFGEEASSLNPQSQDFIPKMLSVATKYPLVMNSEAGQVAIGMLGTANKNFLMQQQDLTNFGQQKELAGINHQFRMAEGAADDARGFVNTPGGLFNKGTNELVEGTAPARKPVKPNLVSVGGELYDADNKEWVAGKPKKELTPFEKFKIQQAEEKSSGTDEKLQIEGTIKALGAEASSLDREASNIQQTLKSLNPDDPKAPALSQRLKDIEISRDLNRKKLQRVQDYASPVDIDFGNPFTGNTPLVPEAATPMRDRDPYPEFSGGNGGAGVLPPPEALQTPVPGKIDRETARKLLQEAGGDVQKARAKASQMGYQP